MLIYKKFLIRLYFFSSTIFLTGCLIIATLPDGQQSIMSAELNLQRANLIIDPIQLNQALHYTPKKKCLYKEFRLEYGNNSAEIYDTFLTVKSIKEKYLLIIKKENSRISTTSTALINPNGEILDFNLVDPSDNMRLTVENYRTVISEKKRQLKEKVGYTYAPEKTHYLNPVSIFMPEFINPEYITPNTVVAQVKSDDGSVWGSFLYQGVSVFKGKHVLVLDLITNSDTFDNKPVIAGFYLMDISSKLPIYTVFDAGSKIITEHIYCNN